MHKEKYTERKNKPIITTIKIEEKKKQILQDIQKLRRSIESKENDKSYSVKPKEKKNVAHQDIACMESVVHRGDGLLRRFQRRQ